MAKAVRSSGSGVIILSCSDPRLNPYQIFGVDPTIKGVTMVRNAGGRALDAIRTISVLQTIGNPKTVVVLHHTGQSSSAKAANWANWTKISNSSR